MNTNMTISLLSNSPIGFLSVGMCIYTRLKYDICSFSLKAFYAKIHFYMVF